MARLDLPAWFVVPTTAVLAMGLLLAVAVQQILPAAFAAGAGAVLLGVQCMTVFMLAVKLQSPRDDANPTRMEVAA